MRSPLGWDSLSRGRVHGTGFDSKPTTALAVEDKLFEGIVKRCQRRAVRQSTVGLSESLVLEVVVVR